MDGRLQVPQVICPINRPKSVTPLCNSESKPRNQLIMMISKALAFTFFFLLLAFPSEARSDFCQPSGKLKGKEGSCNTQNDSECCLGGKQYSTFHCSPKVSSKTPATLTLNSFQKGGDGGGASSCDGTFHPDSTPVVALSTGWFDNKSRCSKFIIITANGKKVKAKVVDECDSTLGCDSDHAFQPPCKNNIVDASEAVWKALDIPKNKWGELDVTWTDA